MFSSPRIISKLGTLLQESRLRPSQEQKEIPDSAPRSCSLLHTAQSSFLPLGALEGMAHWQCKGMSLSLGNHLSDPNVTYTDSTSSSGHFLCRLWKAQLDILGTLSYTGRKCQPSKQDLGYKFPEMPVPSFSGGFLCWLGSQLPLQLSALCILSETLTCPGLWRTGGMWILYEGQRPESQVLQKLSSDLEFCHTGDALREIINTVRSLGESVYPWLEQIQGQGLLSFWKSIKLWSLKLAGECTLEHRSGDARTYRIILVSFNLQCALQ